MWKKCHILKVFSLKVSFWLLKTHYLKVNQKILDIHDRKWPLLTCQRILHMINVSLVEILVLRQSAHNISNCEKGVKGSKVDNVSTYCIILLWNFTTNTFRKSVAIFPTKNSKSKMGCNFSNTVAIFPMRLQYFLLQYFQTPCKSISRRKFCFIV